MVTSQTQAILALLILTRGECEDQPVGLVESGSTTTFYGEDINDVLTQLGKVSGNTYTINGTTTTGGCAFRMPRLKQPFGIMNIKFREGGAFRGFLEDVQASQSSMAYVTNTVPGVETIEDISIPETDAFLPAQAAN